jgi:hypothetical protein
MRPRLEQNPSWRRTLEWYSLVYVFRGSGTYYDGKGSRSSVIATQESHR